MLDAQISYHFRKAKTILSLEGTHVYNNLHIQAIMAPRIGAAYFLQLNFDSFLN